MSNLHLLSTLGNAQWMADNEEKLRSIFKPEGEAVTQGLLLRIGFRLKLLGVDWRSTDELTKCLTFLMKSKVIETTPDMKTVYPYGAMVKVAPAHPPLVVVTMVTKDPSHPWQLLTGVVTWMENGEQVVKKAEADTMSGLFQLLFGGPAARAFWKEHAPHGVVIDGHTKYVVPPQTAEVKTGGAAK